MTTEHLLCGICTVLTLGASAQVPIAPVWTHVWAHGQDAFPVALPLAADNHVTVDPITGFIHVSVDAGPNGTVVNGDQVYTFSTNGEELSPVPAPYVGSLMASKVDPLLSEGTADLVAYNGTIWALRTVNTVGMSRTAGSIVALKPDGSRLQVGLGGSTNRGHLAVDAAGVVAIRSIELSNAGLNAVDTQGWITYSEHYPGTALPDDACFDGNAIFSIHSGQVTPFVRSNGLAQSAWPAFAGVFPAQIAAQAGLLYFAYADGNGTCTWGARTLAGGYVWQRTEDLGIQVEEMHVDDFGRPWFIGNAVEDGGAPVLVVTASDGQTYETFTYGARMNDLALGGGQAYITGQALAEGTSTFLLAMRTDLTTTAPARPKESGMLLFPQPAQDQFTIAKVGRVAWFRVVDLTGKTLLVSSNTNTVEVGTLHEGMYLLEASTVSGTITQRFVVAR